MLSYSVSSHKYKDVATRANNSTQLAVRRNALKEWLELSPAERKREAARALEAREDDALWSLTEAYLKKEGQKGSSVSALTLRAYRFALLALLDAWSGKALLKAGPDDAKLYVRELEAGVRDPGDPKAFLVAPLKESTILKRVAVGKHFYEALRWCGLYHSDNPFDRPGVTGDVKRAEDKREAYTLEDVVALFRAAASEDDTTDLLIVLLTVLAGLRASEALSLTWDALSLDDGLAKLRGKGDKPRFAPLADLLIVALLEHADRREDAHPLVLVRAYRGLGPFTDAGLRYRIDELCKRTFGGTDPRTGKGRGYRALHSFRHTFGSEMHKVLPLFTLSRILGHSDIKTTAIYGLGSSKAAAEGALGRARQKRALEARLLENRDEGVNALGRLLFLSLSEAQRHTWQLRARRLSPGLNLTGSEQGE